MPTKQTPAAAAPAAPRQSQVAPGERRVTPLKAMKTLQSVANALGRPSTREEHPKAWADTIKETARVVGIVNPPLAVTLHLPGWCAARWREQAAAVGLTVDQLMTFLVTGNWDHDAVLNEGVRFLCEDTILGLAKKTARRKEEEFIKVAVEMRPATFALAKERAEAWADAERRGGVLEKVAADRA